ncbi:hypothetical protein BS50DRAFT_503626 [Corynespora cassiicola Philippines]|uniref:Ferric oxidoreductase domain-containing protein n=1 Tax=Corynespora cassiicola Philippines TaxID=1448308 RepID=A0A2T2N979_CORCC|nr:hypothetical protein BS50DRAFT_503626 [Corynespora cassiicola Philippines]
MKHRIEAFAATLLPFAFLASTVGLTYAPCYATLCTEDFLPRETKIHLGTFYVMLALFAIGLLLRSSFDSCNALCSRGTPFKIPIIQKRITCGGFLASVWIVSATLGTTGIWLPSLLDYWGRRTDPLDWTSAKIQLTITGVTGHYADFLMGILVIPVSRNSLVGRAFGVHQSTLFFVHKIVSYLFLAAVLAHGIGYALYATSPSSEGDERKDEAFSTGNPTMTCEEGKARSSWYGTTTYNGAATLVVIIIIVVTSLPYIRRRHYNFFYYFHIICGVSIVGGASVHASTDFYLVLPGLFLYVIDLIHRFFFGEAGGLRRKTVATVENAGGDWYRISVPPFERAAAGEESCSLSTEKATSTGYPLKCFYLNFPAISKMQIHAFTAAKSSTIDSGAVFLFQRSQGKPQKALDKEWTWKLGALVPKKNDRKEMELRLEGPYLPRDTRFETTSRIICIVGGTGITGAHSLALWWLEMRASNDHSHFTLIWTIRHGEATAIDEWVQLKQIASFTPRLKLVAHVSSETGRLDPEAHLRQSLGFDQVTETTTITSGQETAWVYGSGPDGLLHTTDSACAKIWRNIRKGSDTSNVKELNWYMAKWEV